LVLGVLNQDKNVLINGGYGSTGKLAIQIEKLFDVEVIGVDRTEKLDMMRALGANHAIDYKKKIPLKTNNNMIWSLILKQTGLFLIMSAHYLKMDFMQRLVVKLLEFFSCY